jgi:hypothetical protein
MSRAILLLLLLFAACKSRPPWASGYLVDYSQLRPHPERPNTWGWQRPETDRAAYDRLVIEPVLIHLLEDSPAKKLDAAEMRKIAGDLHAGLSAAVEPYYAVATAGASHAQRLQVVITDVTPATAGKSGGIAIEADITDAVTGTRLAATVSRIEWPYEAGKPALDPARLSAAYAEWAHRLLHYLDSQVDG